KSSRSRSRRASTEPSGWGWLSSSNARTTWRSASDSRRRARCSAGSSSVPTRPSDEAGGAGRSTYVTSAWTIFLGLKISARRSSRSSGTLTTPTWSSRPPNPPVSAWPRVSVLKTVVLPEPASPTIAICMGEAYRGDVRRGASGPMTHTDRNASRDRAHRSGSHQTNVTGRRFPPIDDGSGHLPRSFTPILIGDGDQRLVRRFSVAARRVDDVQQRFPDRESAEVVAEQLDA